MRVSRTQAAENRQTVINVASRLFRERGFHGMIPVFPHYWHLEGRALVPGNRSCGSSCICLDRLRSASIWNIGFERNLK